MNSFLQFSVRCLLKGLISQKKFSLIVMHNNCNIYIYCIALEMHILLKYLLPFFSLKENELHPFLCININK